LLLPLPDPYDFDVSTERFRAFGVDLANLWHDGGLHRVVSGRDVRIEAARKETDSRMNRESSRAASTSAAAGGVDVEPLDDETRPVVLKLLGAEFELEPFHAWAGEQPVLGELVARLAGFRPPLAPDPFESLVTSISAQQVSLHAAFAVRNRLIQRFGERADFAFAFPSRERIARASEDELVALGFSRRKAGYVVGLARADVDLGGLAALDDDEVRAAITSLRGLGPWTAEWFLARHLARPRAWPAGDLGLRKGADLLYGLDVHELGRRLDPFQNLSAHYLLTGMRVASPA
jgi:DNA-3-methyladenine glycosylase II